MPFADRLRTAFRDTPWCAGIATTALVVWVLTFFGVSAPMSILGGQLDVAHAWRWLTYPLANLVPPSGLIWFAVGLVFFVLFIGDLERGWGSVRFLRIFLVFTLLAAATEWLAYTVAAASIPPQVWGMRVPAGAMFMIWCALNREATIMFMFVLPIQAKYLAIIDVVLMFFDDRGPVFGLAAALVLVVAWFWAMRYAVGGIRRAAPARPRRGLREWWQDRRRAQRKGRFQVLEGGTPALGSVPTKIGSLQSLSKTPPPKHDEPSEKELDRILDKIRVEGMSALTETEKATLDAQSRRLRGDA